jgi:hypothetical protein
VRDNWIGWDGKQFVENLISNPSSKAAKRLLNALNDLLSEVYKKDFISEKIFTAKHLKFPDEKDHKDIAAKGKKV